MIYPNDYKMDQKPIKPSSGEVILVIISFVVLMLIFI